MIEFKIESSDTEGYLGVFGDDFMVVGMMGDSIVQEEVLASFISNDIRIRTFEFTLMQDVNRLGFRIRNQNISQRTANYNVDYFILSGVEITKFYIPNSLSIDTRKMVSSANLVELSQVAESSGAVGADFSGAYSPAYGGSFNTTLN